MAWTAESRRAYNRAYREKNLEKLRQNNREWRAKNPDYRRQYEKEWRAKNPDYDKKRGRQRYLQNTEEMKARASAYQKANREKINRRLRERYKETGNKQRACQAKWRKNNPNKVRDYGLRTKYKISLEDWNEMLHRQNNCCEICREAFSKEFSLRPCVDHDHKTNGVRGLLCHGCNVGLGHVEKSEWAVLARAYLDKHAV